METLSGWTEDNAKERIGLDNRWKNKERKTTERNNWTNETKMIGRGRMGRCRKMVNNDMDTGRCLSIKKPDTYKYMIFRTNKG